VLTLGKTYRIGKRGSTSALALPINGELRLVRWARGRWQLLPANNAVTYATEPSVEEVVSEWGCPIEELDAFVEAEFYSQVIDVHRVRSMETRKV